MNLVEDVLDERVYMRTCSSSESMATTCSSSKSGRRVDNSVVVERVWSVNESTLSRSSNESRQRDDDDVLVQRIHMVFVVQWASSNAVTSSSSLGPKSARPCNRLG